jgi:hypothetical protein
VASASVQFQTNIAYTDTPAAETLQYLLVDVPCIPSTATCDWSLHFERILVYGPAVCDVYVWLPDIDGGAPDTDGTYIGSLSGTADITLTGAAPILPHGGVRVGIYTTTYSGWRLYDHSAGAPYDSFYNTDETVPCAKALLRQRQSPRATPSRVRATDLRAKQTPYI